MEFRIGLIFILLGLILLFMGYNEEIDPTQYVETCCGPYRSSFFSSFSTPPKAPDNIKLKNSEAKFSGEYQNVTFRTLSNFLPQSNLKKSNLPSSIQSLDNKRVFLDGYMLPIHFKQGKTSKFLLMGSQKDCCFGSSPKINHWALVTMKKQQVATIFPTTTHCRVFGILEVGQASEQEKQSSIYRMQAIQVEESQN